MSLRDATSYKKRVVCYETNAVRTGAQIHIQQSYTFKLGVQACPTYLAMLILICVSFEFYTPLISEAFMFIYSKRNVLKVYLKEVTLLRKQTINTEYRKLIPGLIMLILYHSTECSFQDSIASV